MNNFGVSVHPGLVCGHCAARIEEEWRGGGARRGRWCEGESPKTAGPSGEDLHLLQPCAPSATVAIVGGKYALCGLEGIFGS